jgi:alpha-glucosidase
VHTPVTFETEDGLFIALHEAALIDFPSMTLARSDVDSLGVTLKADLVPWSDGVLARGATPHQSSWRTIQIADSPGGLLTSYIALNLNEPNSLGADVAEWARPGKYVGVWWEIHIGRSSWDQTPIHGARTENVVPYIDFAAEHGFDHVLVEGWNVGWDGELVRERRCVRLQHALRCIRHRLPEPSTPVSEEYASWDTTRRAPASSTTSVRCRMRTTGPETTAFVRSRRATWVMVRISSAWMMDGTSIVNGTTGSIWFGTIRSVEEAARRQIGLNIHEPIKDTGLRRTWPNLMTREGARGQEYNAWGEDGGNPPEHVAIVPFTRMLSGPFDYTPAIFGIDIPEREENRINSTLAQQLAHMVILYSPLQMAADTPDNYERHMDAFQFIKDVPADWETTRVLHGSIGNYVTIVRQERGGTDWYLGSSPMITVAF